MKPLLYGYMRVASNALGDEIDQERHRLAEFAELEGFTLAHIFVDVVRSSASAFDALLAALKGSEVNDVIVPSPWHLASLPGLQAAVRHQLELETGAHLWTVQGNKP